MQWRFTYNMDTKLHVLTIGVIRSPIGLFLEVVLCLLTHILVSSLNLVEFFFVVGLQTSFSLSSLLSSNFLWECSWICVWSLPCFLFNELCLCFLLHHVHAPSSIFWSLLQTLVLTWFGSLCGWEEPFLKSKNILVGIGFQAHNIIFLKLLPGFANPFVHLFDCLALLGLLIS